MAAKSGASFVVVKLDFLAAKLPPISQSPKGGWGYLMSPPCLESQSSHLIPFYYLLSCASAHSYCSFCLLSFLSTYWPILLTFPPKILVWLLFSS